MGPKPTPPRLTKTPILERDRFRIRCFSCVVSTLLRRLAVGVPHAQACFAILRHEESESNVAALTVCITLGGVLVNAVFQFVVLEAERPPHQLTIVIVARLVRPTYENTLVLLALITNL